MSDGIGKIYSQIQTVQNRSNVYNSESIQEIRARAKIMQQKTTASERDNLTRLNQVLRNEKPLKDNMPRGYYLNISI
ncbi:MAG: hypothetical protein VX923_08245 [Pseudomonadota bacterium]|nr:hypothetical protein [Pseudomonadota bacterium]